MARPHLGTEKRNHARIIFPVRKRPVFRARGQTFEIKDLSRGGLKFGSRSKTKIRGWVTGTIRLHDGTAIDVEGIIVRIDGQEMGLSFIGTLEDKDYGRITRSFRIASA